MRTNGRPAMWASVEQHELDWFHHLAKLRGESLSAMFRAFVIAHARELHARGELYPGQKEVDRAQR